MRLNGPFFRLLPVLLVVQCFSPTFAADYDWLIRKEFDGKYNQTRPAQAFYEDSAGSEAYYGIDAAFAWRIGRNDACLSDESCDQWLDVVGEFHRSQKVGSEVHRSSIGLSYGIQIGSPATETKDGSRTEGRNLVMLVSAFGKLSRNSKDNDSESQVGVFIAPYKAVGKLRITAPAKRVTDEELYRWQPSLGIERFGSMSIGGAPNDSDLTAAAARLLFSYWPFPHQKDWTRIELTCDGTYYRRMSGVESVGQRFYVLSAGVNLYFDGAKNAGIGLLYERGRPVAENLTMGRTVTLALKAKLGGNGG